jgi:hypothetical protein
MSDFEPQPAPTDDTPQVHVADQTDVQAPSTEAPAAVSEAVVDQVVVQPAEEFVDQASGQPAEAVADEAAAAPEVVAELPSETPQAVTEDPISSEQLVVQESVVPVVPVVPAADEGFATSGSAGENVGDQGIVDTLEVAAAPVTGEVSNVVEPASESPSIAVQSAPHVSEIGAEQSAQPQAEEAAELGSPGSPVFAEDGSAEDATHVPPVIPTEDQSGWEATTKPDVSPAKASTADEPAQASGATEHGQASEHRQAKLWGGRCCGLGGDCVVLQLRRRLSVSAPLTNADTACV